MTTGMSVVALGKHLEPGGSAVVGDPRVRLGMLDGCPAGRARTVLADLTKEDQLTHTPDFPGMAKPRAGSKLPKRPKSDVQRLKASSSNWSHGSTTLVSSSWICDSSDDECDWFDDELVKPEDREAAAAAAERLNGSSFCLVQ